MDEEDASGGEFEIERIPTSMIEARPKDLVPIFNYMQTPKFQQTRAPPMDSKINGQVLHHGSDQPYGNGRISPRSISGSLEGMN
ncbi:autophagy-related protein 18f-like, partial [Trifolium medium]|nr:autophagy-related protein 18f-like [Trifolium medium]